MWRKSHLVLILRCTTRSLTATILSRRSRVLISDMITISEEKASADDTHIATHSAFEAKHIFNSMHAEIEMMRYMTMSQHKDLYLTISMISLVLCSWLEVMNIPFDLASNTISYREMLNFLEAYLSCTSRQTALRVSTRISK